VFAILRSSNEVLGWEVDLSGSPAEFSASDSGTAVAWTSSGNIIAAGELTTAGGPGGPVQSEFVVVERSGSTAAPLWRYDLAQGGGFNAVSAITLDPTDDVVAVGSGGATGSASGAFVVAKLAGSDGTPIWLQTIGSHDGGFASSVVLDQDGDVIAGGYTITSTGSVLTVVKLSAPDGNQIWRYDLPGVGTPTGSLAASVSVDSAGDVLVGGGVSTMPNLVAFAVLKLSGADGTEKWRYLTPGESNFASAYSTVALSSGNDVIAGGGLFSGSIVVRLQGSSGQEVWRRDFPLAASGANLVDAVALTSDGNAVVGGSFGDSAQLGANQSIAKLAVVDGSELWEQQPEGFVGAIQVAQTGDIVTVGFDSPANANTFAISKLSGADGTTRWKRSIEGSASPTGGNQGLRVAVDSTGNVAAVGLVSNADTGSDFATVRLDGSTGFCGACGAGPLTNLLNVEKVAIKPGMNGAIKVSADVLTATLVDPPFESFYAFGVSVQDFVSLNETTVPLWSSNQCRVASGLVACASSDRRFKLALKRLRSSDLVYRLTVSMRKIPIQVPLSPPLRVTLQTDVLSFTAVAPNCIIQQSGGVICRAV
jgi:hypothetical protein